MKKLLLLFFISAQLYSSQELNKKLLSQEQKETNEQCDSFSIGDRQACPYCKKAALVIPCDSCAQNLFTEWQSHKASAALKRADGYFRLSIDQEDPRYKSVTSKAAKAIEEKAFKVCQRPSKDELSIIFDERERLMKEMTKELENNKVQVPLNSALSVVFKKKKPAKKDQDCCTVL